MRGKASNTNKGNAKAYRKVMDGSEIKKLFNKLASTSVITQRENKI